MSESIGDIISVLNKLTDGENKFHLWHEVNENVPDNKFVLTLTSKYGFRRFLVTKEMDLSEAKKMAVLIDHDLCQMPSPDYCKKYIGHYFIDLSNYK